ncbi:ROK family protein [Cohnella yongneupensis]|uniref:ROK family protein n=1 Tax=Cohnella yongneupensis TaxID=425006 RepID=A0ABW0QYR6_9BACL
MITIGIDVGGTNVVSGLFNDEGRLIRSRKVPTETSQGSAGLLGQLAELCKTLLTEEGLPEGALSAVGIGLPGFIDFKTGEVDAANLPLVRTPVAQKLSELIGVPVTVRNDVKMIVYGESLRGVGKGFDHVLGLTLGTGLASAWVSERKLHDGAAGLAGEIGHIAFSDIPYVCGCGMKGCLETVVSATGIARQARDGLAAGWVGLLAERFPPERRESLTARDVWQAAVDGDGFAIETFRRTAGWLARALAPAIALLSPDIIIVGGGVASSGELFLQPLHAVLSSSLHPLYAERLRIVTPALGDEAGLYGSSEFAREHLSLAKEASA